MLVHSHVRGHQCTLNLRCILYPMVVNIEDRVLEVWPRNNFDLQILLRSFLSRFWSVSLDRSGKEHNNESWVWPGVLPHVFRILLLILSQTAFNRFLQQTVQSFTQLRQFSIGVFVSELELCFIILWIVILHRPIGNVHIWSKLTRIAPCHIWTIWFLFGYHPAHNWILRPGIRQIVILESGFAI